MRSIAGKLHPLPANPYRVTLDPLLSCWELCPVWGYLLLTAFVSQEAPEQTSGYVCPPLFLIPACFLAAISHFQIFHVIVGPCLFVFLPAVLALNVAGQVQSYSQGCHVYFHGGLGEKWKVGLLVTEAIGRGIVRLQFL